MLETNTFYNAILALGLFMLIAAVQAEPSDDEAVAKARKDYAEAMKGRDVGLQNAMKIQLSVQLAKSKERVVKEKTPNGATDPQ